VAAGADPHGVLARCGSSESRNDLGRIERNYALWCHDHRRPDRRDRKPQDPPVWRQEVPL